MGSPSLHPISAWTRSSTWPAAPRLDSDMPLAARYTTRDGDGPMWSACSDQKAVRS